MQGDIYEIDGTLTGTLSSVKGLQGALSPPRAMAGNLATTAPMQGTNGIVVNDKVISLDEIVFDCGTSTTVLWEG